MWCVWSEGNKTRNERVTQGGLVLRKRKRGLLAKEATTFFKLGLSLASFKSTITRLNIVFQLIEIRFSALHMRNCFIVHHLQFNCNSNDSNAHQRDKLLELLTAKYFGKVLALDLIELFHIRSCRSSQLLCK